MRSDLRKRHMEHCHAVALEQQNANEATRSSSSPTISKRPTATTPRTTSHGNTQGRTPLAADALIDADELPSETAYAATFLAQFHRSFPLLHESTFARSSPPLALLRATACIGALQARTDQSTTISRSLFRSGVEALCKYVNDDRARYQQDWVLQAFILYELYGLYSGDEVLSQKATTIHTNLVDALRIYQMTQGTGSPSDTEAVDDLDEHRLQERWQQFIERETKVRCVYALYLLDTQRAILCNLRPILSSLEIKHDLPCDEDLWLASTAKDWAALMSQRFKSFNDCEDFLAFEENIPDSSFYASTQFLLHPQPARDTPSRLRLLWSSPFAALVLVSQLAMVVRELTHAACLLERPCFSQRSLSVLTETQYSQISQALRSISELVPQSEVSASTTGAASSPGLWRTWPAAFSLAHPLTSPASHVDTQQSHSALWEHFHMMWHYTWITLSHPDALIVRGVVETSLAGAIATAGHLGRPKAKSQRDLYEDRDVFRLLNSLDRSLRQLAAGTNHYEEHPFATLLGFKISLVGWRLVRLTMNDLSKPSGFVLETLLSACGLSSTISEGTAAPELTYLRWLVQAFEERNVWPVGYWTGQVLREMAQDSETMGALADTALKSALE